MLDAGCWMLDAWCLMLDAWCWLLDGWMLVADGWWLKADGWKLMADSCPPNKKSPPLMRRAPVFFCDFKHEGTGCQELKKGGHPPEGDRGESSMHIAGRPHNNIAGKEKQKICLDAGSVGSRNCAQDLSRRPGMPGRRHLLFGWCGLWFQGLPKSLCPNAAPIKRFGDKFIEQNSPAFPAC